MPLSEENRKTLLINLHKWIEESANTSANHIFHGRFNQLINYPPNGGLTKEEVKVLVELNGKDNLKSALRKIFASTTADVFFEFLNVVDGTSDPDLGTGEWYQVSIVDKSDDNDKDMEFLHDDFYGSYWDWKGKRKNNNWTLDLENGG
jgi:hypothetical protein